jgi:serine/threonine protein kinase
MEPAIGTTTEALTLLRELGRGGMGVVYLARDHERGDLCAVKFLHPHLTQDETTIRRFQTEARAAAAIDHPAIVQVRGDLARLRDGPWYCVMEYLDGLTLTQLVAQRGPLPLALILEIIGPLCDALNLAHAANIVHRDLKPDNVMVVLGADAYRPKLLDFGIAKLIDEPGVTRPGVAPGTGAYMAPEQTRGDLVDRRSDVYALGVMVYYLITGGHLPYDAPDRALYHQQMTEPPIDPRRRCASVPDFAVEPILAASHLDPARRPSTAGEFAVMLARRLIGDSPLSDGVAILQRVSPRLLVGTNLTETLRAPGLSPARVSEYAAWPYDYREELGKGGFGVVLRALKRGAAGVTLPFAIKRILPELARTKEFVEMFHQEARIAALLLAHPNIVKVVDHLTDPWGQLVIVMEFVEGVDLDKLHRSGPLPWPVIIFLITEILEGLGYAHDLPPLGGLSSPEEHAARAKIRGIIHRDMSHHNVMVSWHGAVKVMDFGIAKLRETTLAPGSVMIKGKPAYMSPEQASGAVTLDRRSDLFSVGIMLFELLTGHSLFDRDDNQRTLHAVMFAAIPRPASYNPNIPADLEQVTMRLLERNPDNR